MKESNSIEYVLLRRAINIIPYQVALAVVGEEVHAARLVLQVRVERLALVQTEPDGASLVVEPLLVGHLKEEVDQVDGQSAALFEPEGGDGEGGSDVILDPQLVNPGLT